MSGIASLQRLNAEYWLLRDVGREGCDGKSLKTHPSGQVFTTDFISFSLLDVFHL
jgi:hypothetical protein